MLIVNFEKLTIKKILVITSNTIYYTARHLAVAQCIVIGGRKEKKYIEMFGSFTEPFNLPINKLVIYQ